MRIVSLLPSATDIIAELGLLEHVVGVSEDCNWPPEVRKKPQVARTRIDLKGPSAAEIDRLVSAAASETHSLWALDRELIDALAPDLLITQDLCTVCAVSSGDLESACPLGAEVYSMNPHSLEDVIVSVVELAARLGVAERGRSLAAAMRAKIDSVRAAVAGRPPVPVFVAEWVDPPYGCGHWLPEMVEAAGGRNLLSRPGEYSFPTSWEAILAADPKLIVLACCGFGIEQALAHCASLRLPVRTVVVDGDSYYSRPAPRTAEGVRQLAHLLHPAAVEDPGLPAHELPIGALSAA